MNVEFTLKLLSWENLHELLESILKEIEDRNERFQRAVPSDMEEFTEMDSMDDKQDR